MSIAGSCHCGKTAFRMDAEIPTELTRCPAFEPDGKWDDSTRRVGVNARLFDGFDAALARIILIDGKHLW